MIRSFALLLQQMTFYSSRGEVSFAGRTLLMVRSATAASPPCRVLASVRCARLLMV
jgi:hypothetical protein